MPLEPFLPTVETTRRSRQEVPDTVDVALIGAGPSSLTAAAYLAKAGMKVAVFDSHYVAGGCATQFSRGKRGQRWLFDVGLHYIGDCGPGGIFPRLLEPVGVDVEYVPMDEDGFDTLVFPDLEFRIPVGVDRYRDRLVEHFPSEVRGIDRYVRFLREIERLGDKLVATRGKQTWGFLWEVATRGRMVARYQNATLKDVLDGCTSNRRLRAVMSGQHGDYGLPPSKVSAVLHAGLAMHYFRGAYYPRGGGQILADELARSIEAHGGGVHLRKGVEKVLVDGGRAAGLRLEGGHEVRAGVVVSGADLRATMVDLVGPDHLAASEVRRHESWEWPAALYLACLGVDDDLAARGMRATNYWQYDHDDFEEVYAACDRPGEPAPQGCYITSATLKDPDTPHHAPDGKHTVEVMSLVPGSPEAWGVTPDELRDGSYSKKAEYKRRKQAVENDLLRRFDDLFPGVGQRIVFRESATPLSHVRYTRATGGTGYGISATPGQFGPNRPGPRASVPGLYLCGASARSGHGLAGALQGGMVAAGAIGRDLGRPVPTP